MHEKGHVQIQASGNISLYYNYRSQIYQEAFYLCWDMVDLQRAIWPQLH